MVALISLGVMLYLYWQISELQCQVTELKEQIADLEGDDE